jgi:hypothetical protein
MIGVIAGGLQGAPRVLVAPIEILLDFMLLSAYNKPGHRVQLHASTFSR